ncbi:TPA: 30S ribosomal protein S27e [Candidatus Woesearchaeota archaeon]|nr:30S ribosomal protein S27e [Candidatus Woesearchaeota archaeon]
MAQTRSKFVKVRCTKCKNEQIIFDTVSTVVSCLVCSKELALPTGGKAQVEGLVLEVLD